MMSTEQGLQTLFQREADKAEIIGALRHALDTQYRRFVQAARADWERLIGSDPSDACVTVRVSKDQPAAIRGSGFLKSRREPVSKTNGKSSVPRFAH
jgi:hypothetical protein